MSTSSDEQPGDASAVGADQPPDGPKSFLLTPALADYIEAHSQPPDAALRELVARTRQLGGVAAMQISPEQGAFLTVLTRAIGARTVVEVGTFTGYSAICLARGLPSDGRLIACDISDEWTRIAREAWLQAGVADRIELRLGPALETLQRLPREPTIDLAFLDADKGGYHAYYEELVTRLRPGGIVLADNVLWSGRVVDPDAQDDDTTALRAFNDAVASDDRVETAMVPVADGLLLAQKR